MFILQVSGTDFIDQIVRNVENSGVAPAQPNKQKNDPTSRYLSNTDQTTTNNTDSFKPDTIEQFKSLLREGISPDSKTIQGFLTENNLTNDPKIKEILESREKDLKKLHQYVLDGLDKENPLVQEILLNGTLSQREISHTINTATIQKESQELASKKSLMLRVITPVCPLLPAIHDAPRAWNIGTSALSEAWGWLTE